jgi:SAM-dependent methyltransferase
MGDTNTAYNSLSAEFYDLDPTYPPEKEVAFLSSFIAQGVPGPWLEAMSGSGRILIPLLQKGFMVEGIDNSPFMLSRCTQRMKQLHLETPIYDQSVTQLALPKKYSGIIICFASFQLLFDRALALKTLQRFKEHLVPGGMILIDIFVPWQSIKRAILDGSLVRHARIEDAPVQWVYGANCSIERKAIIDVYAHEQYVIVRNSYIKRDKNYAVIDTEEEEMIFLWYYRYEMAVLLEQAGFSTVNIIDQNEETVTYQAVLTL